MTATGVETELIELLTVFIIAGGVGVFVTKYVDVPYMIALLVAGFSRRSRASPSGSN